MIQYLLDENVDPHLRDALARQSPDIVVWCAGDPGAPPLQADEPSAIRYLLSAIRYAAAYAIASSGAGGMKPASISACVIS